MLKNKKIITIMVISYIILGNLYAKNVENVFETNIVFDYNTRIKENTIDLQIKKQNSFLKVLSYSPYFGLHLNSFTNEESKIPENLDLFNHWADNFVSDTVLLNWLLLGTPYIVMGIYDAFTCPYMLYYGIDLDLHPYVNDYFDLKTGVGLKNDSYPVLINSNKTEWVRPFFTFKTEAIGRYKFITGKICIGYNYDLSYKIRKEEDLSNWNIMVSVGLGFNRKTPSSKIDKYFDTNNKEIDEDEYIAEFDI